jgi:hypothetical protein
MTAYICGATGELIENHHPDRCVECLIRSRDEWKRLANTDLVEQLRNQALVIRNQRIELARLNGCKH